ncbi:MAG: GHMP kinase [Chloroflexota bacterium]|nr:GHMP kinase [Chloroflexota bacterium]
MTNSAEVTVRVPVRIDFAGGWTDVHYFSAHEGGAVLNGAINLYVEGRATSGERGLRVEYGMTIPSGSGLGTSAALDVAWLALTNRLLGRTRSEVELAEDAYRLEKLLGVEGGKQDQYSAALGGFNYLTFAAEDQPAEVERLAVPSSVVSELYDRTVLAYTGSAHSSSSVHAGVWNRYRAGEEEVSSALREMRRLAREARDALMAGDLDSLAVLVTRTRECSRRLHPALVTPHMDELFATGEQAGAAGSKACGAGGGGCIVFICQPNKRTDVERALAARGAELVPFEFQLARPLG